MRRLNFKIKILIYFIVVAIIPFALSWIFTYCTYDRKAQQDLKNMNYMYMQNQISEIEHMLKEQEDTFTSIAQSFSYIDTKDSDIRFFLGDQSKTNDYFLNLYIIGTDGNIYYKASETPLTDIDFTKLHSYTAAMKAKELVWLEPYTDTISGQRCIGMSIPVYDRNGDTMGVMVGNISLKTFQGLVGNAKYMADVELYFINSSGYVKFRTNNEYYETDNIQDADFVLNPAAESIMYLDEGYREFSHMGKNWICTFFTINSNGWKIVSLVDSDMFLSKFSIINQNTNTLIIAIAILCVLMALIASVFLYGSIVRPLTVLRDGVKAFSGGDLDSRIEIKSSNEIEEVAEAFNEMAKNLKNTYKDLIIRTDELCNNNKELQEINMELESSYEQLEAAMSQLNASEEKYKTVVNNISDMVVIINLHGYIVYVNDSVETITGYSESELMMKSVSAFIKGENLVFELLHCPEYDYRMFQKEILRKDGSIIIVEGSVKKIKEDGVVVGIQAIARDVTQKITMEEQLRKKYNELQTLNRISLAITSTMDLNSMLTTVVNQVTDATDALVCSIRLLDDIDHNRLELKAINGVRVEEYDRKAIDIREDLIGTAVQRKNIVIAELNIDNVPSEYYRILYEEEQARFVAFNPLCVKSSVIGVMTVVTRTKPDNERVEFLNSLANNLAIGFDNTKAYATLKQSYLKTVRSLVSVMEAKDEYTESHSIRVAKYASFIASEMGSSKSFLEDIGVAGVLHDIGKIGISDSILNKRDKLTHEEYEIVKQHPDIAHRIVSKIGLSDDIIRAIKYHHERYDGKGYPDRIKGGDIPSMAAIISVADAFDAITSNRPYRSSRSIREGIKEIVANRGMQFNPRVVDTFEKAFLLKPEILDKIYSDEEVDFF